MQNLSSTIDKNVSIGVKHIMFQFLMLIFMCIGLYLCSKLFFWVYETKFDKIETVKGNEITKEFRQRQLACLARNIYYEAGNEPFEGKVAVAQVTINRANATGFPDDICMVIYQKNIIYQRVVCQFSWYCDRDAKIKPLNQSVYNESMEVAKQVLLEGFRLPSLYDALYYHADYVNPGWSKQRITKIGRHIFYK